MRRGAHAHDPISRIKSAKQIYTWINRAKIIVSSFVAILTFMAVFIWRAYVHEQLHIYIWNIHLPRGQYNPMFVEVSGDIFLWKPRRPWNLAKKANNKQPHLLSPIPNSHFSKLVCISSDDTANANIIRLTLVAPCNWKKFDHVLRGNINQFESHSTNRWQSRRSVIIFCNMILNG